MGNRRILSVYVFQSVWVCVSERERDREEEMVTPQRCDVAEKCAFLFWMCSIWVFGSGCGSDGLKV